MKVTNIKSITNKYIQKRLNNNVNSPTSNIGAFGINREQASRIKFETMRELVNLGYSDREVHLIMLKKAIPKLEKIEEHFGVDICNKLRLLNLGPKKSEEALRERYMLASLFWEASNP